MRAIVYSEAGDPDVLRLVNRPLPEPGPGEVVVAVRVSGVNPTDWKSRRSARLGAGMPIAAQVPNQDGAGTIHSVGEGVSPTLVGQRVWIWEAAWQRSQGTAQEYVALPARQAVPLPHEASFDLGASIGIPALTAHRCLTTSESGPSSLAPGVLSGRIVLVAGGAGAVGHAAIQLARWAGAMVIATISTPEKAQIARAAGANHVVDYRRSDAADEIRELAPQGIDVIVEVAPAANAVLDVAIVAEHGTVAAYASDADELSVPVRELMFRNIRYQFVLVYTVPSEAKETAISDVSAAVAAGALPVGEGAGLPLHRFPLERTADAHAAVEAGTVGKVLVDVTT
jgi:NADPH2:quinone reductase